MKRTFAAITAALAVLIAPASVSAQSAAVPPGGNPVLTAAQSGGAAVPPGGAPVLNAAPPDGQVVTPPQGVAEAPPTFVRITGRLATPPGAIRPDMVLLTLALYESQDATTPLWVEQQAVAVDADGRYAAFAGATLPAGLPRDLFASDAARWLGVTATGESEQPRIMLLSVPYALKARDAETLGGKAPSDFVLAAKTGDAAKLPGDQTKDTVGPTPTPSSVSTTGRIAKFSDTINTTVDSIITESGGNIGIGTAAPGTVLDANGVNAAGLLTLRGGDNGAGGNSWTQVRFGFNATATYPHFIRTRHATAAGAGNAIDFYTNDGTSAGVFPTNAVLGMTIDNGNVGIGVTGPGHKLDIQGSNTTPYVSSSNSAVMPAGGLNLNIQNTGSAANSFASLHFLALNGSSAIGYLGFTTTAAAGGDFVFGQRTGNNSYAEQMRITNAGNVGIGTTGPAAKLDVNNVAGGTGGLRVLGNDPSNAAIEFSNTLGRSYSLRAGVTSVSQQGFSIYDKVAAATRLVIDNSGNVGIGTTAPAAALDVAGNVNVTGNIAARYQDVAEWVETSTPLVAGTVVIVDPKNPNRVLPSPRGYDTRVAGAVSAQPGLVLGERGDSKAMVAQSGRVRVKVDASYGAIRIGDLLVTSPTPGYAMRSRPMRVGGQSLHRPGTLLGKALEALPNGKGEILVLLTLQ